ncbi:glycoside hydrolase family 140 protein [Jiulongibacter sp. NS-SX5]|uniref:glycoside hydrolase family 140 protein n=1 Tax=Jiulongibacter sp. NS-SX5 TaxID=3463854 RepID=UPI004058189B
MKKLLLFLSLISFSLSAQLPRLEVSENGRFLQTEEGKPFFWTADTAWELFHKLDKEEATQYLEKRASQGFNVIQAVGLAELDGLNTPNAYGYKALDSTDPIKINVQYFNNVAWVMEKADSLGLYVAFLPTWGDKLFKESWGAGPEIFNEKNAYEFGKSLALRLRSQNNIIWVLGGDRNPRKNSKDVQVWNEMARGIKEGLGLFVDGIFTFHPQPASLGGSSNWFHKEEWLNFNLHQTGHCPDGLTFQKISHDYQLEPVKPTIDGEPLYEDHPNCFDAKNKGYSTASDIRRIMYWNVFAGAAGQSYGCHDVWQMHTAKDAGVNNPLRPWHAALDLPMANQVKHLKNLMLSRPYFDRIPDQSLIESEQPEDLEYAIATRDDSGTYAMIYVPTGKTININTKELRGQLLNVWWYDPRTGATFLLGQTQNFGSFSAVAPSSGLANDWVLVIDDVRKGYDKPGTVAY